MSEVNFELTCSAGKKPVFTVFPFYTDVPQSKKNKNKMNTCTCIDMIGTLVSGPYTCNKQKVKRIREMLY